jgi:hypothetical protein
MALEDNPVQHSLFRKVSFDLHFEPSETVELAYCVPYTYSTLLEDIKEFK